MENAGSRAWRHMRALWPRWTLLPPLPFVAYALYSLACGNLRFEHVLLAVVATVLAYATVATKRLLIGVYPLGLVGVFYDAMRPFQNVGVTPERVHVCDLRSAELFAFGIDIAGERATLHDWFRQHPSLVLDALCAIPYGTFIFVSIAFGIYLYAKDFRAMQRFTWAFFLVNLAGFATWHLYPAAPPWYFHAHGCAVDVLTKPNEGPSLANVDALMGFRYFGSMYGRASSVFGAVPSLHCAYPLMIVLAGWRRLGKVGRSLAVGYYLWMCFSAVYLDHHWVIDVLLGSVYCVMAYLVARAIWSDPKVVPGAAEELAAQEAVLLETAEGTADRALPTDTAVGNDP